MSFKIYKGEDVVVEGESPLAITGLDTSTDVATGEYQAVRVDGDEESDRVDIPAFKTLPEITTDEVSEEIDVVEYDTVRNDTEELPKGEEETVQEGVDGYTKVTYKVTYEDGVESDREETGRETIDPVDEIINVGTFEEPEPEPEPEPED